MRQPYRFVTVAAVLLAATLGAGWIVRDVDRQGAQAAEGARDAQESRDAREARQAPDGQATGFTAEEAMAAHETAERGPRQPIPFSHRFHVSELGIDCAYCHLGTERSQMAVVPALEVCMGCHRTAGTGLEPIEELRGYWSRNEPVAWEWVTKLPDFVQFSHRAHLRNDLACETCHGPVAEMDRVYQWAPLTMGWCLECHRGAPAETDVATDHRLTRDAPPPEATRARQPHSFYPTSIDQKYGAFRGPIDCLACHY